MFYKPSSESNTPKPRRGKQLLVLPVEKQHVNSTQSLMEFDVNEVGRMGAGLYVGFWMCTREVGGSNAFRAFQEPEVIGHMNSVGSHAMHISMLRAWVKTHYTVPSNRDRVLQETTLPGISYCWQFLGECHSSYALLTLLSPCSFCFALCTHVSCRSDSSAVPTSVGAA